MKDHLVVVDNFYRLNEDLMAPQQYEAAKMDYEYFLSLCAWRWNIGKWKRVRKKIYFFSEGKATAPVYATVETSAPNSAALAPVVSSGCRFSRYLGHQAPG